MSSMRGSFDGAHLLSKYPMKVVLGYMVLVARNDLQPYLKDP